MKNKQHVNSKKKVLLFTNNRRGTDIGMNQILGIVIALAVIIIVSILIYRYFNAPNKFMESCQFTGGVIIKNEDSCPSEKPYVSLISKKSTTGNKCCVSSMTG